MRKALRELKSVLTPARRVFERSELPCGQAGNGSAAHTRIVARILVRQGVMDFVIVEFDGRFGMLFGLSTRSHKKVVGPEHVVRLDRDARVVILVHANASAGDLVGSARLAADHVVLCTPAERRETSGFVAQFLA